MQLSHRRISSVAVVAATLMFSFPAHGEVEVIEAYTTTGSGGLTRDSLSDANLVQTRPARTAPGNAARRRRERTDPKDFIASRSHHHPHEGQRTRSRLAGKSTSKHRGPVVGFVYWWNGWVIRTFHTRFGTVLLGTIGSKS